MSGPRLERILTSTALALILAAPIGASAIAQDAGASSATAATPSQAAAAAGAAAARQAAAEPAPSATTATPSQAAAAAGAAAVARREAAAMPSTAPAATSETATAPNDAAVPAPATNPAVASEQAAVEALYQDRHLAPLWLDKGAQNARAQAVIARLKGAEADGLDVNDYKTPTFAGLSPDALAEAELKLTQTVLTYARHLQSGRFPYTRVSNNIELPQEPPDPAAILAKIANAANAGTALDDFSPPHEGYKKLKAMLAQMRGKAPAAKEIAEGQ